MEKIYVEEKSQIKQTSKFSVMLSFCVAIFAMFSIAVFGIANIQGNGISYAASPTGEDLTFYKWENPGQMNVFVDARVNGSIVYSVPLYYSDVNHTNPVFCVERNNPNTQTGTTYTKNSEIDDYGLLYLLNNSFANGVRVLDGNDDDAFESFITQTAIWLYLYEKGDSQNTFTAEEIADLKRANELSYVIPGQIQETTYPLSAGTSVYDVVKALVDDARTASSERKLNVSKASDEFVKSEDGTVYRTSLITVSGSNLINYSVELTLNNGTGSTDGINLIDENGQTLQKTDIPVGTKFYVTIPADMVTTTEQSLRISVTGKFNYLTGNYYVAPSNGDPYQKIVSVTGTTRNDSAYIDYVFVGAPDTGMNKAQTVYFVGLIVLLCGIGIVYANAKPVEVQQ